MNPLIDAYVDEIGQHLPRKMQMDLKTEIRSLVEDTLESRSQAENRPVDDQMVVEVLKQFGSPAKMAAKYLPPRYLIGPRLFPLFWLVARIVLAVLGAVALVSLGFQLSQEATSIHQALPIVGQAILDFVTTALSALGNMVLAFAILEQLLPKKVLSEVTEEDWDPRTLQIKPAEDRIAMPGLVAGILLTLAAILVFNFYPGLLNFRYLQGGRWVSSPILSEAFFRMLPWITGLWILEIVKDAVLLRQGRYTLPIRWFEVALKAAGIGVALALLLGPSIVRPDAFSSLPEAGEILSAMLPAVVRGALFLAVLLNGIELVRTIYRLVVRRPEVLKFTDRGK